MSQDQERLSPEEIKQRQESSMKFYQEQTAYLEATRQYEELVAQIEESRTRQVNAMFKRVQMQMQMQGPKEGSVPTKEASSIITP